MKILLITLLKTERYRFHFVHISVCLSVCTCVCLLPSKPYHFEQTPSMWSLQPRVSIFYTWIKHGLKLCLRKVSGWSAKCQNFKVGAFQWLFDTLCMSLRTPLSYQVINIEFLFHIWIKQGLNLCLVKVLCRSVKNVQNDRILKVYFYDCLLHCSWAYVCHFSIKIWA